MIAELEGDNTYKEGRTGNETRNWTADGTQRLAGKLTQRVDFGTAGGILEETNNSQGAK